MYNAEAFLADAVASVLAQTTTVPWELLLVDDGSEDRTLAMACGFAEAMPTRVGVLRHASGSNLGTSATRNLGIRHARGKLLAFLDADDVWLPDMLHSQLRLLRHHPEAAMVYANAERTWDMSLPFLPETGPQGYNSLPPVLPPGARHGLLPPPLALEWFLTDETLAPCTCTVLVRTDVARAAGCFEESFDGLYDDQVFYAKIMLAHPVAVSTKCVARYRRHRGSCCVQSWDDAALQLTARRRFEDWLTGYRDAFESAQEALAAD
ncbi:MAG: glycosyltransferase family 2 protein [Rhodospirillales bacterium]|nr:glycosyltransferase family 2 protein [Acetobacter sp.]